MKDKFIALVDGNNFFAGCEVFKNPNLKGKPVCVLSNNDGCVIARSNEAKKLGISMGMPYFMAKKQFPEAVYLSADFSLYRNLSERMMAYLENFSDKIDVYSIDEAFLDVTGVDKFFNTDYKTLAALMKREIEENVGVNVSVGIANSKILAKIATHKAKSLSGSYYINKSAIRFDLQNLPVEEIWNVGKNTARTLKAFGIFTAEQILDVEDNFFKSRFGKRGLELKYELSGMSVIPLTGIVEKPKSIQRTRAFPEFSSQKNYILSELDLHLHSVCKKLRENSLECQFVGVMLRTKDFRVIYRCVKLDYPTNSELVVKPVVMAVFNEIFQEGVMYRSAGIYASELEESIKSQMNLFNVFDYKKEKNISCVIDKMETKYGKGTIALGATGIKSVMEKHKRKIGKNL